MIANILDVVAAPRSARIIRANLSARRIRTTFADIRGELGARTLHNDVGFPVIGDSAMLVSLRTLITLSVLAVLAVSDAASQEHPSPASIEGDIYLVMKNGEIKPAASNRVFLISDFTINEIVRRICQSEPTSHEIRLRDSLAARKFRADSAWDRWQLARAGNPAIGLPGADAQALQIAFNATRDSVSRLPRDWPSRSALLLAEAFENEGRSASTGMRAHYMFEGVAPGEYFLWARTKLFDNSYYWLTPVIVGPGDRRVKDLDNAVVHEGDRTCR